MKLPEAWEILSLFVLNIMQGKKALLLFLALLLPVSIFIFLKLFGKNEFDVPAFYQDKAPVTGCEFNYSAPYKVADSVMAKLSAKRKTDLYMIYFSQITSRMQQEIDTGAVAIVNGQEEWTEDQRATFRKCVLAVPKSEDIVLVDKEGKIRGYFVSTDREEVDRLLLELEILLKKY